MREYLPNLQTKEGALALLHIATDSIKNSILKKLAKKPLASSEFLVWPAASKNHHAYDGGLVIHTAQVMQTATAMLAGLNNPRIDELICAVMWHDYAKIVDYTYLPPVDSSGRPATEYPKTTHYRDIGHLVGSVLAISQEPEFKQLPVQVADFLIHLLLSHHGRKEWGSPITPNCAEAWCLHAADMLSAQYTRDSHVGPSQ
jgi:3'-5' exoribonuclease